MSNAITLYDETEKVASAMVKSGYFQDSRDVSQAIVKILAGREMGFGAFASMTGVYIIQGRPSVGANLMASAVKRSGRYDYRVIEMTDTACEIEYLQAGKPIGRSRFTIEDARKAQTKNLDKFPRNMLFARAMSNGVRWYCPDVFDGAPVYTPEELGADVTESGDVVPGSFVEAKPEPAPKPQATAAPVVVDAPAQAVTQSKSGEDYAAMEIPDLARRHAHYSKVSRDTTISEDERVEAGATVKYLDSLIKAKRQQ